MGDFHIHKPSPKDNARTPDDAIRKIRYSPVENLYVFKNGRQVRRFVGDIDRITVDNIFLAEMKDATLVHNHPQGTSFSKEDIEAICLYNAKELILVTHDHIYQVSRPGDSWDLDFSDDVVQQQYEESCAMAENTAMKYVAKNEIGSSDRNRVKIHYIWELFFN